MLKAFDKSVAFPVRDRDTMFVLLEGREIGKRMDLVIKRGIKEKVHCEIYKEKKKKDFNQFRLP